MDSGFRRNDGGFPALRGFFNRPLKGGVIPLPASLAMTLKGGVIPLSLGFFNSPVKGG